MCDQNSGVQSLDRQTHTWTDKSLKTVGPMILSNDIFFFKNVIIGGPILLLLLLLLLLFESVYHTTEKAEVLRFPAHHHDSLDKMSSFQALIKSFTAS